MIILDIETTGFNPQKCGLFSIGALDFHNLENTFYQEARINEEDEISEEALKINGITEEEAKSPKRQTQKQLLENFFSWLEKQKIKILAGHNVGFFDINFLKIKAEQYNIKIKTRYRSLDLCSVAQTKYFQINKKFLLDELQENAMGLPNVLEFCGIPEKRIMFDQKKLIKKGTPHNALEDVKLETECFSRILYGKSLLPEFKQFPIPKKLQNPQ